MRKEQPQTHVEAVVVAEDELELGGKVADGAGHEAEEDGGGAADEAARGRDRDEAGDGARAEADGGPLALEAPVPEHPRQPADARGEVGDDARLRGAEVGGKGRAAVEAEPEG
jgi:hypothetical protein